MHKNATKCNETLSKWCKNKHGASKIMDTLETYQAPVKKGNYRSSKCLKKAVVASTSLDTHRPMVSADDVSIASYDLLCLLLELPYSCLPFDRF
jgi:hypothetical protein